MLQWDFPIAQHSYSLGIYPHHIKYKCQMETSYVLHIPTFPFICYTNNWFHSGCQWHVFLTILMVWWCMTSLPVICLFFKYNSVVKGSYFSLIRLLLICRVPILVFFILLANVYSPMTCTVFQGYVSPIQIKFTN